MTHSFVGYIDESGDDGIGNARQLGAHGGQTRWLVISACVFRATNDLEAVAWRDEISRLMPEKNSRDLHFTRMNHGQRIAAVQSLVTRPVQIISILSNKETIRADVFTEKNQLYFYLTRYLIERISWLCRDSRPKVPEGDGRIKITFSRRGGLSYSGFKAYLERLKTVEDQEIRIHWPVIDVDGIDAQDHSTHAALQLVDLVASSFAAGVEPDKFGNCEWRYAETLRPIVYQRRGNYFSYGVKVVPRHTDFALTPNQARFIALFGG